MKKIILLITAVLLMTSSLYAAEGDWDVCKSTIINECCDIRGVKIELDDNDIIFSSKHKDEDVRITSNYKLYINGELIETSEEQDKMLEEYHNLTMDIVEDAVEIGKEGAKIGLQGAVVGTKALAGLMKAFLTSYEMEDFERDIEYETDKLEAEAEKLEIEAEKIEQLADNLEDLHDDLKDDIEELDDLHWF